MSWKLDGNRALLDTDSLTIVVKLDQPHNGIGEPVFAGERLIGLQPLQITAHPPVSQETLLECYVRGTDLVASYAQLPERTVRPQFTYRQLDRAALGSSKCTAVELVISVQTSLLDSDPTFNSLTEAVVDEVYLLAASDRTWSRCEPCETQLAKNDWAGAFVFRLKGLSISFAELIFPSDFQGADLAFEADRVQLSYQLFPEFLEKGVIRKGRMWAVWMSRDGDLDCAADCYARMTAAPPPLTV